MSDIIYTPPASSGGGVNPTSTYMPVNIGGTFVDSICQSVPNTFWQTVNGGIGFGFSTSLGTGENYIGDFNNLIDGKFLKVQNDTITSRIFTSQSGFYLDYNVRQYRFGEYNNFFNGTHLFVDDTTELIFTKNNNISTGLSCDFNIRQFLFGSYGAGNLTYLSIEDNLETISTKYQTNTIGLSLDYAQQLYSFGDFNSVSSGVSFYINEANSTIYTKHSGQQEGLFFDFVNDYFSIGDFNNTNNGTYLKIDDDNSNITTFYQTNGSGLQLDFTNRIFILGDYGGFYGGTGIRVSDNNYTINTICNGNKGILLDGNTDRYVLGDHGNSIGFIAETTNGNFSMGNLVSNTYFGVGINGNFNTVYNGNGIGLNLDCSNFEFYLGDYNTTNNGTSIFINDNVKQIRLNAQSGEIAFLTDALLFSGSALQSSSAGGNSGQHLVITLNGNQYKIKLENP
jgi:hypothetical protein